MVEGRLGLDKFVATKVVLNRSESKAGDITRLAMLTKVGDILLLILVRC